jgi:fructokinase
MADPLADPVQTNTREESTGPTIVVCGEALIDLTHAPSDPAGRYHAYEGGGPHNTAVGLGRLGTHTGFLGRLSTDRFGQMLRTNLTESNVDLGYVVDTIDPTMLAVATLSDAGHASYAFYTVGTADVALSVDDLRDLGPSVRALHFGTLSLALEQMGSTLAALLHRERAHRLIAIDPNVRLSVIADVDSYRARLVDLLAASDVVKISDADLAGVWTNAPIDDTAARLFASGPALLCVTRGGDGVSVHHASGVFEVPSVPVDVVDTIGAGDTFNAGLLAWLDRHDLLARGAVAAMTADQVRSAVKFAASAAAVTCGRAGANPPWAHEVAWT